MKFLDIFYKHEQPSFDSKQSREIISRVFHGNIVYSVEFYTNRTHNIYICGILVKTYKKWMDKRSNLLFKSQRAAEAYAKSMDYNDFEYYQNDPQHPTRIIVFPKGYKTVEKYGHFEFNISSILVDDYQIFGNHKQMYFVFDDEYKNLYGSSYEINQSELFNGHDIISDMIKALHIEENGKVVKKFDYESLQELPLDKSKATLEELKRLEELVAEYNNTTEKYINLIDTINKR